MIAVGFPIPRITPSTFHASGVMGMIGGGVAGIGGMKAAIGFGSWSASGGSRAGVGVRAGAIGAGRRRTARLRVWPSWGQRSRTLKLMIQSAITAGHHAY